MKLIRLADSSIVHYWHKCGYMGKYQCSLCATKLSSNSMVYDTVGYGIDEEDADIYCEECTNNKYTLAMSTYDYHRELNRYDDIQCNHPKCQ